MKLDTEKLMTWFENVLTIKMLQWIINPYGDINEINVILQVE